MSEKPLFIRRAEQLVTLRGSSDAPLCGEAMKDLKIIENGSVWIEEGVIQKVGTDEELATYYRERLQEAEEIDAGGGWLLRIG